jgi:hypothetical protein
MSLRRCAVSLPALLLILASPLRAAADNAQLVPASAPEFRYEGRFDFRSPGGPVITWQSSRVRVEFEGERLALVFDAIEGQNVFDVEVDGTSRVVAVPSGSDLRRVYLPPLGRGRHRLTLFKRTEAMVGSLRFRGVELAEGARVFAAADPGYRMRMEFSGNSITAGACNEDGDADQWENRITHNSAKSYAAMTAAAFGADHRNIAVSGMGVSTGYVDVTAGEAWDRLYPRLTDPWVSDSKTSLAHLAGFHEAVARDGERGVRRPAGDQGTRDLQRRRGGHPLFVGLSRSM